MRASALNPQTLHRVQYQQKSSWKEVLGRLSPWLTPWFDSNLRTECHILCVICVNLVDSSATLRKLRTFSTTYKLAKPHDAHL